MESIWSLLRFLGFAVFVSAGLFALICGLVLVREIPSTNTTGELLGISVIGAIVSWLGYRLMQYDDKSVTPTQAFDDVADGRMKDSFAFGSVPTDAQAEAGNHAWKQSTDSHSDPFDAPLG